jgi:hypothetical protein
MGSVIIEPVSENYARLTRKSELTGAQNVMLIPVSAKRLNDYYVNQNNPEKRQHVQTAFPELNADLREFILTGISPVEWSEAFMDRPE